MRLGRVVDIGPGVGLSVQAINRRIFGAFGRGGRRERVRESSGVGVGGGSSAQGLVVFGVERDGRSEDMESGQEKQQGPRTRLS